MPSRNTWQKKQNVYPHDLSFKIFTSLTFNWSDIDNSLEPSPIICDGVCECKHVIWNHSSQQNLSRSFRFWGWRTHLFSSSRRGWYRSRDYDWSIRILILCRVWGVLQILVQLQCTFSFHISCIIKRRPGPSEEKQPCDIKDPPPTDSWLLFCLAISLSGPKSPLMNVAKKIYFGLIWP